MFLLVGGDSEIGKAVAAYLRRRHPTLATTRRALNSADDRIGLDLSGDLSAWEPPAGVTAACICAAVARLADCANDPAASTRVNVTGTLALAERLLARGIHVIFLSTTQVFDGCTPQAPADAPTAPVSEYGAQKARAEAGLRSLMGRTAPVAILRLAKVVSPQTVPLCGWKAALAARRSIHPPAFDDMTMAPTPIGAVARAIEAMMSDRVSGVFQLTGPRDVTYAEAARYLARRLGADLSLVETKGFASARLPVGAAPPHTTLDSTALRERYGIVVPDAWEVLDELSRGH
jgi:dTDP-4-dehydrorhamnose reductase